MSLKSQKLKFYLWVGTSFAVVSVVSASAYILLSLKTANSTNRVATPTAIQTLSCVTIATDPKPPLNIRSSPIVAPDNVIGKVRNGTQLTVIDENEGWLRIRAPFDGWVYKELTVTSCTPTTQITTTQTATGSTAKSEPPAKGDRGEEIFKEATDQYHAGNLEEAVQLANSISANSPAYTHAQATVPVWQRDWRLAETKFASAQKALEAGQWQGVINQVSGFPDNRYWRGKLTPLVKEAIRQQRTQSQSKV
jgi:hypothetical protein